MFRKLFHVLMGLALIATFQIVSVAGEPKDTNIDWENACNGSNIRITRVDGKIVSIDAFVEHHFEGRQWQCHYTDGKIVSALYRHLWSSAKHSVMQENLRQNSTMIS